MKYALLIHEDHANYKDEDGWNEIIRRHEAFGDRLFGLDRRVGDGG